MRDSELRKVKRSVLVLTLLATLSCRERSSSTSPPDPATPLPAPANAPAPKPPDPYVQPAASVELPGGVMAPASFADLARQTDPAVVFVETEQAVLGHGGRRMVGEGLGSGFIFDPSGLILTNHHVVAHATRIEVALAAGRKLQARVVGSDPPTDLAVLRVEATDLPHLEFGDSDQARVGDWVLAIGNPFGLSHTVSAGILSAKGRTRHDVSGLDASGYYDFLQTDASINPGNSGGPLLDLSGRVVGINTAIKPQANSIGFAIPINMVRELLPALLQHGKVRRSGIGVVVASPRSEDVERLKLSTAAGALITRVLAGGPGDRAGLRVDDVIVGFAENGALEPQRLRWMASIAGVGREVPVKVLRGGREIALSVKLGELPKAPEEAGSERMAHP
jgi:serine protease Do